MACFRIPSPYKMSCFLFNIRDVYFVSNINLILI